MHRLQTLAMILGALAMVALYAASAGDGRLGGAIPLGPFEISALAALGLAAALLAATLAWNGVATGKFEYQKTRMGVPVTRVGTPKHFWFQVVILSFFAAAFLWLAVYVVGYGFGWWSGTIEL